MHPIKVTLAAGAFHLPGMIGYEQNRPDRCYLSGEAAEADGFIRATR